MPHAHPPRSNRLRRLPRNVWVVTAVSFLTDISSEMVLNLLPIFLSNVLGVRSCTPLYDLGAIPCPERDLRSTGRFV